MRCYEEECDYELDELGDDAWLTGCPMCGGTCHDRSEQALKEIDDRLNQIVSDMLIYNDDCSKMK